MRYDDTMIQNGGVCRRQFNGTFIADKSRVNYV